MGILPNEVSLALDAPLILVRGAPGSGKSTLAKCIAEVDKRAHFEADQYFMIDGEYMWSRELHPAAHKWTLYRAVQCLERGKKVVVSNTFTRIWEMEPYFELDFDTAVIRMTSSHGNIHGVPEAAVKAMRNRIEEYAGEVIL